MKLVLPVVTLHPAPPVSVHVPVIDPPESVVPFNPFSVPVTVPLSVRVLPPDCTVNFKVPVTVKLVVFSVKIMDPVSVPPVTGKHCAEFEVRN